MRVLKCEGENEGKDSGEDGGEDENEDEVIMTMKVKGK